MAISICGSKISETFRLKILFIITRSDVMGGASVHLIDLAKALKASGAEVHIASGGNGILQDKAIAAGLTITMIPSLKREISPFHDIKACWQIRRVIKAYAPDLVHLHSSKAGLIGRLVCSILKVPSVFTAHGWAFTEGVSERRRKVYRLLERLAAPLAAKIITVSDYDRDLAIKYNVGTPERLITIHNGVPDNLPAAKSTRETPAIVKLIMVARFEKPKQQQLVLQTLALLHDLSWQFEFVGDGPELDAAIALCKHLNLADRVVFSGACSDVGKRLAESDIFVLFSAWEGLPLTILEAMSCGLPVVASDVGGVKETFDVNSGYLIPKGAQELHAAQSVLRQLIVDGTLRQKMGEAARERYVAAFSLQRMLEATQAVYEEVLAN